MHEAIHICGLVCTDATSLYLLVHPSRARAVVVATGVSVKCDCSAHRLFVTLTIRSLAFKCDLQNSYTARRLNKLAMAS